MDSDLITTVNGKEQVVTYKQWSDLIQASFEKCYYVPVGEESLCKYFEHSTDCE